MSQPPYSPYPQQALPGCWWHPDRATGLSCVRCGRPACPDCLREASVGSQCVDCVQAGRQQQRAQQRQYRSLDYGERTVAGAKLARRPIVTPVLIALNVLVYLITVLQSGSPMDNQNSQLQQDGVLWPYGVAGGEWWRLITSGFLHYGLLHIAVNMFALWVLGRDLELLLGKIRFTAVYFVSLLGGSVAVYQFSDPNGPTAGASGALYGLMGGLLVAVLRLKLNPGFAIGTIVLNLVITYAIPGISLYAHVGGLVVGVLAMAAMLYAPAKGRAGWQAGTVVVLLIALVGLYLYRDAQLAGVYCRYVGSELNCYLAR
ncbi:rhomboid family intramembrane serine protease [Amycolatopsis nigrescens]|uniref:rhomboid family intramembrane serine protease n=1 Tax=Amycolatopsis nigrescens TaxID=381445 RepID=UPI0006842CD9|nr:rhomboid family intramembrane serine protease [Amycolatopsis nigrescens]